jgi:pantoate--beta-alanine ligase
MLHVDRIADLRAACDAARASGKRVGLVPTMGYLHAGHRSLMRSAAAATDFVVVTIFVNPLQFGANEDLDRYPRDLAGDLAACAAEGADCVFAPGVADMYPRPPLTTVHVGNLTADLCGAARPTHFDGVTTVVAKLFSIIGPSRAYFGRKDAQQLAVIRRMATDLDLPVDVVGCPLVRETDGLALSSRNVYLDAEARQAATILSGSLYMASEAVVRGQRDAAAVRQLIVDTVGQAPQVRLDYVEIVDAATLEPVDDLTSDTLVALAAFVGKARLIDNVTITFAAGVPTPDLGVLTASSGMQEADH